MNFVANFNLNKNEIEADFEVNQPAEFDAVLEINPSGANWGNITGYLSDQTDLQNALDLKADKSEVEEDITTLDNKIDNVQSDLSGDISTLNTNLTAEINARTSADSGLQSQITQNATDINSLKTTINDFGDIVSYDAADFATAAQGEKANTALQPNDNITLLTNNAGYITNTDLPSLEDLTTTEQLNAINSGATTSKIGQIITNTSNISSLTTTVTNSLEIVGTVITCLPATLTNTIIIGNNFGVNSNCSNAILMGSHTGGICINGSSYSNTFSIITDAEIYKLLDLSNGKIIDARINKQTSITSSSTDDQIPSAKCVYDELTDKADTDLSNLSSTGQKVIDGQWILSQHTLSSVATKSSTTIDISSYLPNDNYDYEVMIYVTAHYNSTACAIGVGTVANPLDNDNFAFRGYIRSNSTEWANTCVLPVSHTDRNIYSQRHAAVKSMDVVMRGYRRIGTNS